MRNAVRPQEASARTSTPHQPSPQRDMSSVSLSCLETQRPCTSAGASGAATAAMATTQNPDIMPTAKQRLARPAMTNLAETLPVRRLPLAAFVLVVLMLVALWLPAAMLALA